MSNSCGWLISFLACLEGCLGHRNLNWCSRSDMVYHLKYQDSRISRSLSSYGSDQTRIGGFPG